MERHYNTFVGYREELVQRRKCLVCLHCVLTMPQELCKAFCMDYLIQPVHQANEVCNSYSHFTEDKIKAWRGTIGCMAIVI